MDSDLLEKLTRKLHLTSEEENSVRLPDDVWSSSVIDSERCLVERVIARKQVHTESFEKTMIGAWGLTGGVQFQKLGGDRFLIQFEYPVEKRRVYWRSPWAFDKNLVVIREIPQDMDLMTVDLTKCEFHVHVAGLPFSFCNQIVAKYLGNAMGTFCSFKESTGKDSWSVPMRI